MSSASAASASAATAQRVATAQRAATEPAGSPTPSIAVVVCAYTPARLQQTLTAVREARRQADGDADEVILVVDHHAELLGQARELVPGGVRVLASTGEPGLSGARNTGWLAATADVVAFCDDDAVPRPHWVSALRRRMSEATVGVVGGAVHPAWEGGSAPAWFPPEFGWVVGCDYRGLPGDGAAIRNPIGACMAVRRSVLEAVGGFSSEVGRVGALPVGCEETLLGIRVQQMLPGVRSVRDEAFAVDHAVSRARQGVAYFLRRCFHEGRSKALVARAVGARDALASERSYVLRTLSRAVARDLLAGARGHTSAVARAAATVAGLAVTVSGLASVSRTTRPVATRPSLAPPGAPAVTAPDLPARPVAPDELVSVVVCTLGRDERLRRTVAGILAQSHHRLELIVVDNDPASGRTAALLAGVGDGRGDLRLRIVDEPVKGLSAARNTGLAAAAGELIAYTDDDAVPDGDWIEQLVSVLRDDRHGEVGCVTGRVLAAETVTAEQRWFEEAGIFDKGSAATTWALGERHLLHLGAPGERSAFFPYTAGEMGSGNNMVFRTAWLRRLGGFDEALGAGSLTKGGEDLDVFRRVVLAGQVVVYAPAAIVRHYHRDTYAALRTQMFGYGTGMAAVLTKIVLGGGDPARAVLARVPRGIHMLLAPTSVKNAKKPAEMPAALVGVELLGYLAGPWLYVRSVHEAARRRQGSRR